MKLPPLEFKNLKCENEFEVLSSVLKTVYYLGQIMKGDSESIKKLPDRLSMAAALYMEHGWNQEGKDIVMEACEVKTTAALNSLNKQLRDYGFMAKETMNNRHTEFTPLMKIIQQSFEAKKKLGEDKIVLTLEFTS